MTEARPGADPTLHWPRSLVAKGPAPLLRQHLHRQIAASDRGRCHLVLLDVSGSMRRQGRLARAKGCAAWLITQAARAGDELGLLLFGGHGVRWLLAPPRAWHGAVHRVPEIGGGGGTPLGKALAVAGAQLRRHRGAPERWLWLLTDGRTDEHPLVPPRAAERIVIVDHDDTRAPLGHCASWAATWGARHLRVGRGSGY